MQIAKRQIKKVLIIILQETLKELTQAGFIKHRQTGKIDSAFLNNGWFTVTGKTTTREFCNIDMGSPVKEIFISAFC